MKPWSRLEFQRKKGNQRDLLQYKNQEVQDYIYVDILATIHVAI